jgi:molybdopterin-guanine dinucleotide biosynthesis protein A
LPGMVGLILAGGKGARLGRPKADLVLHGETLLSRAVHQVRPAVDRVLVSVAAGTALQLPGVEVVPDAYPGQGSIVGLTTGLRAAGESVLALAVDMPFLNLALIRRLISLAPGWDAVIPRSRGWFEPLHAVYAPACLPVFEELIRAGQYQIVPAFSRLRALYLEESELARLDPDGLAFFNINTPSDLQRAEELEKGMRREA